MCVGTAAWRSVVGRSYEVTSEYIYIYKCDTSNELTIHPKKVKVYTDEDGYVHHKKMAVCSDEYSNEYIFSVECEHCLEGKSILSHLAPGTIIKITHLSKCIDLYGVRCSINGSNYKNVTINHMRCFFKYQKPLDSSRRLECLESTMVEVED